MKPMWLTLVPVKWIYASGLTLGLVLAEPAIVQAQSAGAHPAALVDLNDLTIDSDFTVFMRHDVPEEVRRAALRRLWVLMQLPVSCHELCAEAEPAPSVLADVAREKQPVASR